MAECNATLFEIVRGHFYGDLVALRDSNMKFSHLSRKMSQNHVCVGQLDTKHTVGKNFVDNAFDLNLIGFSHGKKCWNQLLFRKWLSPRLGRPGKVSVNPEGVKGRILEP